MPRAREFQAGVRQRMGVLRDGHLVVEAPAPLAVLAEEVVDHALDDLVKGPGLPRDGVVEGVVPLRPGVFLPDRRGGCEELPARGEGLRDLGSQLAGERDDQLFDVDFPAVDFLGPEELRKGLGDVVVDDHGLGLLSMSLWACLLSGPRATWTWLPCGPFLDASGGGNVQMLQEGEAPVKGVIVTGAGRGIGRGARVCMGGCESGDLLRER